ncbi:MAG TPA: hypothetical protein DE315_00840 [Candidatus Omnitrophica bacterium]|nr:hypothetical protein [Candidatus Omnitrophota bacterium]
MKSISRHCPRCKQYAALELHDQTSLNCPRCSARWGRVATLKEIFDSCPVCQCRQFYISKDFNQLLGCLVMLVGIALVPFTYGLSLPVFALFDWLLARRVESLINCYKCGSEFRGFKEETNRFKPFLHHVGLKYDKYR